MMGFFARIKTNIDDVRAFGLPVLTRHIGRLRSDRQVNLRLPDGERVYVRAGESDIAAVRQVFGQHDYVIPAPKETLARLNLAYQRIIGSGKTPLIIDAGANIGAASIYFKRRYPEALVVAIEPDPENLVVLHRNSNSGQRFRVIDAAIGSESGHVSVVQNGLGWATQTVRSDTGTPVVTINDILSANPDCALFIVKVDIEGFEKDLFSSATEWLSQTSAVIIEPHDWMLPGKGTSISFQKAMARHEFEIFFKGENIFYVRL